MSDVKERAALVLEELRLSHRCHDKGPYGEKERHCAGYCHDPFCERREAIIRATALVKELLEHA